MPPKNCSCKRHAEYSEGVDGTIFKISSKKFRKNVVDSLVQNGDLGKQSTYLCSQCAKYAETNLNNNECPTSTNVDNIIKEIENGQIAEADLSRLSYAIAKSQSVAVWTDSNNITQGSKSSTCLESFNCEEWLLNRNAVVLNFLKGIVPNDEMPLIKLTRCIDEIYSLSNSLFISPFAFIKNIVTYFLTGSKGAITLNSALSPSGSYSTMQRWLKEQSKETIEFCGDHDIVSFFDNNQIIQRKWRVEHNFKSVASVITNVIHISPPQQEFLQRNDHLSPKHWLRNSPDDKKDLSKKFQTLNYKFNEIFRKYRDKFIITKINKIYKEQEVKEGNISDNVELLEDVCSRSSSNMDERYTFVPSGHSDKLCSVKMGDPCFENPCSYESVDIVFDHLLKSTKVGEARKWTILGCDGLPFTLGSRLIDDTYKCPVCAQVYLSLDEFNEHRQDFDHALEENLYHCRKYNNIIMIPGLGHFEINMLKAIFKLLWEPCLSQLAKQLGFKSPKALASCENATDHHKSWQIFQILLNAISEELIVPYCRASINAQEVPSLSGYYQWIPSVSSANYHFLREAVFTYCLALHIFRAGVRRNNSEVIQASKAKFAPLFFGFNMPFYMETFIRDSFLRLQCPPEINAFIEKNESYSISGIDTKGEGGDFILEAKNRQTKRLIPAGVPENETWLNVCRNLDRYAKIEQNLNNQLNLKKSDDEKTYQVDLSREIFQFRKLIREKKFIIGGEKLTSLSGGLLDDDLLNFSNICKENMLDFLEHTCKNDVSCRKKYKPIFITPESRQKFEEIENKTKDDLVKMVEEKLSLLDDNSLKKINLIKWKKIRSQKKSVIINYLNELKEY